MFHCSDHSCYIPHNSPLPSLIHFCFIRQTACLPSSHHSSFIPHTLLFYHLHHSYPVPSHYPCSIPITLPFAHPWFIPHTTHAPYLHLLCSILKSTPVPSLMSRLFLALSLLLLLYRCYILYINPVSSLILLLLQPHTISVPSLDPPMFHPTYSCYMLTPLLFHFSQRSCYTLYSSPFSSLIPLL
jgi:hypothetical protein